MSILDGVIRTLPRPRASSVSSKLHAKVDAVLGFDIEDKRKSSRAERAHGLREVSDAYSGRTPGSVCDKCGGALVRRKDDEPDAIRTPSGRVRGRNRSGSSTGTRARTRSRT